MVCKKKLFLFSFFIISHKHLVECTHVCFEFSDVGGAINILFITNYSFIIIAILFLGGQSQIHFLFIANKDKKK